MFTSQREYRKHQLAAVGNHFTGLNKHCERQPAETYSEGLWCK
jgi:hypothetical protein